MGEVISAEAFKTANCFHPLKPCECKAKTILTIQNNESALWVIKQNTAHLLGFVKTVAEWRAEVRGRRESALYRESELCFPVSFWVLHSR